MSIYLLFVYCITIHVVSTGIAQSMIANNNEAKKRTHTACENYRSRVKYHIRLLDVLNAISDTVSSTCYSLTKSKL